MGVGRGQGKGSSAERSSMHTRLQAKPAASETELHSEPAPLHAAKVTKAALGMGHSQQAILALSALLVREQSLFAIERA